jgi:hypothetical protein
MRKPSNPTQVYLDVSLLAQLAEVMELRENTAPDPQRAAAIKELKHIRNLMINGQDPVDLDVARDAANSVLGYLLQLEQSSLGSLGARRLRRRTSAKTISDILNRAEATPAEAVADDAATCHVSSEVAAKQSDAIKVASRERRNSDDAKSRVPNLRVKVYEWAPLGMPIAELTDPSALDVHRAVDAGPGDTALPVLPPYPERDYDREERERVLETFGRSGMVLVFWGLSTGKTRAYLETIQQSPDGWRLDCPAMPLVRIAADGNRNAVHRLVELLVERGDVEEAIALLSKHADTGDQPSAYRSAELLAQRDEVEGLRAWADTGDLDMNRLVYLLTQRSDVEGLRTDLLRSNESAADRLFTILSKRSARAGEQPCRCGFNADGTLPWDKLEATFWRPRPCKTFPEPNQLLLRGSATPNHLALADPCVRAARRRSDSVESPEFARTEGCSG